MRKPIPDDVQEVVLMRSARRCALCFGLEGKLDRVQGQLAHVDHDNTNPALDNIAYLCLAHHDEYDSTTSQSKGITQREVRSYRARLYDAIAEGSHIPRHERQPIAIRADYLEHDRQIFRAAEELLPETRLQEFLERLANDHSYRMQRYQELSEFTWHFRRESSRFLIADVLDPLDLLLAALDDLLDFVATHFFMHPNTQPEKEPAGHRYCMYPDHNVDRGGSGSSKDMAFYDRNAAALGLLIDAASERYAEFRRTVKRTLVV